MTDSNCINDVSLLDQNVEPAENVENTPLALKITVDELDRERDHVPSPRSWKLLKAIASKSSVWAIFTHTDLRRFAQMASVKQVRSGKRIMVAGESATFCVVVLSGALLINTPVTSHTRSRSHSSSSSSDDDSSAPPTPTSARPSAPLGVVAGPGDWVGEMSFFERGVRSADVSATCPSMIAIVTFDAIEAQSRSEPSFYGRLVHIMSTAGFAKLRRQIGRMHRNASSQGHSVCDGLRGSYLFHPICAISPKSWRSLLVLPAAHVAARAKSALDVACRVCPSRSPR